MLDHQSRRQAENVTSLIKGSLFILCVIVCCFIRCILQHWKMSQFYVHHKKGTSVVQKYFLKFMFHHLLFLKIYIHVFTFLCKLILNAVTCYSNKLLNKKCQLLLIFTLVIQGQLEKRHDCVYKILHKSSHTWFIHYLFSLLGKISYSNQVLQELFRT